MAVPKINSSHGSETRNIINRAIEVLNKQGKTIQDLVADGQLTPEQYGQLIKSVNGNISKGNVSVHDIDKNKGKFDQTYFTSDFISQLTDGSPVNAIPADNSIIGKQVVDNTLNSRKFSLFKNAPNIFTGEYVQGHLVGNAASGGYFDMNNSNMRSAIISVSPNEKYLISKDLSDRFRVGFFDSKPIHAKSMTRYIKDAQTTNDESRDIFFEVNSAPGEQFMVVTVSSSNQEPLLVVEEGDSVPGFYSGEVEMNGNIKTKNIVIGGNIFNGVDWHDGTFNQGSGNITDNPGKYALIDVEPNTDYTIYKSASNRFVIASGPNRAGRGFTLLHDDNTVNQVTLKTPSDAYVLCIYIAYESTPPNFMHVEKGTYIPKLETYGYKFEPAAKPYLLENVDPLKTIKDFGAKGDGVTDDTEAIQNALENYAGSKILASPGEYLISKTIYVGSGTTLYGVRGQTTFVLAHDYDLDVINWRGTSATSGAHPILCTKSNSNGITFKDFKLTGSKLTFKDAKTFGLAIIDTEDVDIKNVEVDYINYFPEHTENRTVNGPGWNLAILRSKNIKVNGGKYEYGGYENIGTEFSEDVTFKNVECGIGWRTSFQIHRGSKNIKYIGGTIRQDTADANSAVTFHGTENAPVEKVFIDTVLIDAKTDTSMYRGGLQSVEGHEHDITIVNCDIDASNEAINSSSNSDNLCRKWIVTGNRIKAGTYGVRLKAENFILENNIINSKNTAITITDENNQYNNNLLTNNETVKNW